MESPAISDPSFKAFLEKLQKQNNQQLATELLQLKTEREIAGEDNDKREEQLEDISSTLQTINTRVTGYDIEPLATNGENQLEILKKALEELSLIRKISEGSLEYDKASAQYRNTSGRELVSKVSGKDIKKGGFIDFESASDRLIGQSKRVREQNVLNLKPSVTVQPRTAPTQDKPSRDQEKPSREDESSKFQGFFKELTDGIKFYLTDGLSEKPGYGLFQTPSKEVEKKERQQEISSDRQKIESPNKIVADASKQEISSDRQKIESPNNPESDNITTSQEIVADASKQDLELSKQLLETTKEQLKTLQEIKEALAPKTPAELPSKGPVVELKPEEEKKETGGGLSSIASDALDLLGGRKGAAPKASQTGGRSLGSRLARFATGSGGKILGAAAALGAGAYTAYQGYTGAEEEKQNELKAIDAKIKAGEITPEQGEQLKKETAAKATENKGGSLGEGTGMAAGAIGGGIAGAKVGATIGTFIGGPLGTAIGAGVGGLAGGAIGAVSGSSVGKNIGGAIGKGVAGIKSFFGMEDTKAEKPQEGLSKKGDFSVAGPQGSVEGHHFNGKYYINGQEVSEKEYQAVREKYGVDEKSKTAKELFKQADVQGKTSSTTPSITSPVSSSPTPTSSTVSPVSSGLSKLSKGTNTGLDVMRTSTENADMTREVVSQPSITTPIISNNVQSSNTTKYVPSKPAPRPEYSGSALDRYTNRIAVF